jgi:hypothetical protein
VRWAVIHVVIQTPKSVHIVAMFEPPVEIIHRSPSQCGVDVMKGDETNPHIDAAVQYLA